MIWDAVCFVVTWVQLKKPYQYEFLKDSNIRKQTPVYVKCISYFYRIWQEFLSKRKVKCEVVKFRAKKACRGKWRCSSIHSYYFGTKKESVGRVAQSV